MAYIDFGNTHYNVAFLIRQSGLQEQPLKQHYLEKLNQKGLAIDNIVAVSVEYDGKKPSAKCRRECLDEILSSLVPQGIDTLVCCDGEYFKTLTKQTKAEPHLGYVMPCKVKGYEEVKVIYCPNWQSYFHAPDNKQKSELALDAFVAHSQDCYQELGTNVLTEVHYPSTVEDIAFWLNKLLAYDCLTADIEAFGLKHHSAGIGSITFNWDEHSAVCFAVDAVALAEPEEIQIWDKKDKKFKTKLAYIKQVRNEPVRQLLKNFFDNYKGKHIWHNASYDIYNLTYQLYMSDLLDREGMLQGLDVLLQGCEDTQLITYLATNSCAGNHLGLKENAHEYVGNYAIDVKDIRLQPLDKLLEYNAIDGCATWFVMDKHYPTMVMDEQLEFYETIFKPALHDIIEMQLTGMCLNLDRVREVKVELETIRNDSINTLLSCSLVQGFTEAQIQKEVIRRNAEYKTKTIDASEAKFKFNPNSGKQLQELLFGFIGLPVIDTTATKQPATGGDTLKKLTYHPDALEHTESEQVLSILKALLDFAAVEKILSSFVTTFLSDSVKCPDNTVRIYGSFKLGGTVSARLSASNPNIQQLPSGSRFGKLIKSCFVAPPRSLFVMSDYAALEDVVNTLLTKDPAKEKVMIDGFDGHMYRACHFWPELFTDYDTESKDTVNWLKKQDWSDKIRSRGKPVHFSQQYLGGWMTLHVDSGFPKEEAISISDRYRNMYKVSFDWVDAKIKQASIDGYATCAFGLRVRTPLLKQCIIGNEKTPREAAAESRTLGNAVSGQSYCLLNGRASEEFMRRVRTSKHRLDVALCAHIHDAIYLYIKDDLEVLEWVNNNLIDCMSWCDLPELHHETLRVSSELDIAYPTWKDAFTIPNGASQKQIIDICTAENLKRKSK